MLGRSFQLLIVVLLHLFGPISAKYYYSYNNYAAADTNSSNSTYDEYYEYGESNNTYNNSSYKSSSGGSSSGSGSSSSNNKGGSSATKSGYNKGSNKYGAYGTNFFADTMEYYDGYQQSWRYLGWYVKCGSPSDRYNEEEKSQHSGDEDEETVKYEGNNWCQRYLMWAAYVDPYYQGGGIGEYSFYDHSTRSWDTSACDTHGNGRCAPMDCHLTNTSTWKLMGVFKEASYFGNDAFFEQLFKHEGVCVWNDDDLYEFMSDARENSWPQGCVSTGVKGDSLYFGSSTNTIYNNNMYSNGYLYLDLKPTWNGNMTYGLYTDSACKYEYEGQDVDIDTIAKKMGLLYGSYLQAWNDGMEVFKTCQPCRAYNLQNNYYNGNNNNNNNNKNNNNYNQNYYYKYKNNYYNYGNGYNRNLGDYDYDDDPNEGYFQCNDDADYTNVNQCMKFRTHAELEVATWEDLVTATNQGGILEVNIGGTIFGSQKMSKEEWEYIQGKRRSEVAAAYKKARAEAAKVAAMEPVAKKWEFIGRFSLTVGAFTLLVVAFWVCKKELDYRRHRSFRQPLLGDDSQGNRRSKMQFA